MGFQYINQEQKVRIPLSRRAYMVMNEDMRIFSVPRQAGFINKIIKNFHETAKASLSLYISGKRQEFEELFADSELEEYASLPFMKRERIFKKEVYDTVEYACKMNYLLQVKTIVSGERRTFLVYPYRIVPDPLGTQEYLACYTRTRAESPKDKKDASFSMARLENPVVLKQRAFLSKEEIARIEDDLTKLTVAYLLGEPQEIRVRLTQWGRKAYRTRLYSRPDKDETRSTDEEYVFFCSEQQAYNYFFPFGPDAEIISPPSLRSKVEAGYQEALELYLPS